jgi:hypothetical protein
MVHCQFTFVVQTRCFGDLFCLLRQKKQKPTQFGVLHGSSPSTDPTEWVYNISLMTGAEYVS